MTTGEAGAQNTYPPGIEIPAKEDLNRGIPHLS